MTITDAICSLQGIRTYLATKSCEAVAEGNELATLGFKESVKEVGEIISLLKEQGEREKRICKSICDFIRCTCSTDTDDDKDFVCHEIQKCFMKGR